MSRTRDLFIASIPVIKNRPKMLKECLEHAEVWKKTGELTADEYDFIVEFARKARNLADV
jgi:hypothetical protein